MIGTQDKQAISEVLEILDYMEEEYVNKISPQFLKFLQDNKDVYYKNHINVNIDINSQINNDKTKALLGIIFYNFWFNDIEKREFVKNLKENEVKKQAKLSETFKYEDLFKKNLKIENDNKDLPIIVQKKWYEKLVDILKKVFNIKRKF